MFLSNGSLVTKTPVSLTSSSWFPSMPPMSNGWPNAYAGIYERQLWVTVVVNKLARALARLPLPVYEKNAKGDRERVDDHPLAKLLRDPNPGMTGYDLLLWTSAVRDTFGDAFWQKVRDSNGTVVQLLPLHPTAMTWDEQARVWVFDNGKTPKRQIRDGDVVPFKHFHPTDQTRGMSPLEPLRATLENEWHARNATSSFWQRGARPGMALTHPGTLGGPAQDRLKAQFDNIAAGSGNTGATVVLEEGLTPAPMSLTQEDAQYIETRKLNREEVCAGYDIPPPVVHILDHATFSNITEQMRSMYRDTMGGILPSFESAIDLHLRTEWTDNIYAEFLMDEVLRGDFEARQEALNKATHMTIAEKRKVENLPFIPGTDRIFLNTATLPLDAIDAQAAALVAGTPAAIEPPVIDADVVEDDEDDDTRTIPLSVVRTVLGRLSWQKDMGQVDLDAVTKDLAQDCARNVRAIAEVPGDVADLRKRLRLMARQTKGTVNTPDLTKTQDAIARVLRAYFQHQGDEVLAVEGRGVDDESWNRELTKALHDTAVAVSGQVGKTVMRSLDFDPDTYDVDRTVEFLRAVSKRLATNINKTTTEQYRVAHAADNTGKANAQVFADAKGSRATGIAGGVTTLLGGFAVLESGRRIAEREGTKPTKTWITGPNPRDSHAAMNGQTVPIDSVFSNGLDWPGSGGSVNEIAGCNCSVQVDF